MIFKRFSKYLKAFSVVMLVLPGIIQICDNPAMNIAFAEEETEKSGLDSSLPTVNFVGKRVDVSNDNIVYVELIATGVANHTLTVSYKTKNGNAIEGIDYVGVSNTVTLKTNGMGSASHKIAIKCLNDASTRELFHVHDKDNDTTYGRYFDLKITEVVNANLGDNNVIKCYLNYEYLVEGTTGINDTSIEKREIAYLNEYVDLQITNFSYNTALMYAGNTVISWKDGITFNNSTTSNWINPFINTGVAGAYGSFLIMSADDKAYENWDEDIHFAIGNKEYIDKYNILNTTTPGTSLQFIATTKEDGGNELSGRAMEYISQRINPNSKDNTLLNVSSFQTVVSDSAKRYWKQPYDMWYASKNSVAESTFFRIEPYNGALDFGLTFYNAGQMKKWVTNITMLFGLIDVKAPEIVNQYVEYDHDTGNLRLYIRFNEPVYASKRKDLTVKFNNFNSEKNAEYLEGNYTDTLVYSIDASDLPHVNINSVTYHFPFTDVSDMSYRPDAYGDVRNNYVADNDVERNLTIIGETIDLTLPRLAADREGSTQPSNIYNIVLSANDNGQTDFSKGTVYYSWDKNEEIENPQDPASYEYTHVLTSEEKGSFPITLVQDDSKKIDHGDYYLHALAVSDYGMTATDTFGPYRLDGDPPTVTQLTPERNDLKTKTYLFTIDKKTLGTSYDNISMIAKHRGVDGKTVTNSLELFRNGVKNSDLNNILKVSEDDDRYYYRYYSNIDPDTASTTPLDPFISEIMGEYSRLDVEISFSVTDSANNKSTTNGFRTVYDIRDLFEVGIDIPDTYVEDKSVPISYPVYNIKTASEEDGITFSLVDSDAKALIDAGAVFSVVVNDKPYIATSESPYSVKVTGLGGGFYEAIAKIGGKASETEIDMVSTSTKFYLTNDMNDYTLNKDVIEGNLVLSNRVYQLTDAKFYFFNPDNNTVVSFPYGAGYTPATGRYDGGSLTPSFSSSVEAKKYVKYMEYQDLNLVAISDTIASLLNSGTGSTSYVKASGETKVAQEGQLWIRYKRSSWTTTSESNGWAFYYYGEGKLEDGININALSVNLSGAIDAVVNRIVNTGKEVYLVGEDNLDQTTKAPYLADSQIHVNKETVSSSLSGTKYITNPVYNGDPNLYKNNVTIENVTYPIATNMPITVSDSSVFFFKAIGEETWNHATVEDGQLMKDVLSAQVTGLYTIREYCDSGVGEYSFYLDRSIPLVDATLNKGMKDQTVLTLNGELLTISAKTVTFNRVTNEADEYSYIAIYTYPNRVLETVLYQKDIQNYGLMDGNYYVETGDRSGNVVTYIILTSDTDIELTVEENSEKTGVYVKVNNREASEIYNYEVYLNDNVIDNEFAPSKFYRDSGIYFVTVTDIYGNTETATVSHSAPYPNLNWYYLNDNEGYSAYDPNNPVKMVLEEDPYSPRTTNIYTSTLTRAVLNSKYSDNEVKFEMLDIAGGDYAFNEATGILSVNTLSSWRLRVWYENSPETDHIYVCRIDNTPPDYSAKFIGTSYLPYVKYDSSGKVIVTSTFDAIDLTKYEVGDSITLDTLEYTVDNTAASLSFDSGDIICGGHIIIGVSDPSGIKSYTVSRNGQIITAELDADNQLLLNDYGSYVITVTDNLSNRGIFSFNNVEPSVALGLVDGNYIKENQIVYGHDELTIETSYNGTNTFLIEDNDGSCAYVFRYDGVNLTYGHYVKHEEAYIDSEGIEQKIYSAKYQEAEGFKLTSSGLDNRLDYWYTVTTSDTFVIEAMIDVSYHARYRIRVLDSEIRVQSLSNVGNTKLPARYMANLSKESPKITLLTDGEVVEKTEGVEYIYVNNELTIDENNISANITKIEYAFNTLPLFPEYEVIYANGQFIKEFVGDENGYYRIVVTNIYNNITTYTVAKITAFASIVTIHTLDNSEVTYYTNEGTICSNYSISLIVFSEDVYFDVNGTISSGVREEGSAILELTREGTYQVRAMGENGIFEDFTFEIKSDETFLFQEEWITGYNEEALLRDQSYTNTRCSINLDDDVRFVDMVVNDDLYVKLYDDITDEKLLDPSLLVEAVGKYGDGKYDVGFRNKYGDLVIKTIHYSASPTLVLTRITTNNPNTAVPYDLNLAVEKGFHSNYVLTFSTISSKYIFKINDTEIRLDEPKNIEFTNISGKGSFSYQIEYLDEYGNHIYFQAVLYREDVIIDTSKMSTIDMGTNLYTRDDIVITFGEGLTATVQIGEGTLVPYKSSEVYYADGEYHFIVEDIAGNQNRYSIIHKSANHYEMINSSNNEVVAHGGVVNNANVIFTPSDGSKLSYVVRDGELVTSFNGATFSQTGHWEMLIEDSIGNKTYEEFYVINNELAYFEYSAPYGYTVSEVWHLRSDGTRELTQIKGSKITLNENGDYIVVVSGIDIISTFNFSVTINDSEPAATLVGVEDGGITSRDVTLDGLKIGDVVKIYKDNQLISTTTITISSDVPTINTGGNYRVVIKNIQGVTKEYNFTRKAITNAAGSVFIIVSCALMITGVSISLLHHTRLKTDD